MRLWAHGPSASPARARASDLAINLRIAPIVTDPLHELNTHGAPLTVFAPSRMVAPGDQDERIVGSVTQDMQRTTSAAMRCGDWR
jgi:hypothetical protein